MTKVGRPLPPPSDRLSLTLPHVLRAIIVGAALVCGLAALAVYCNLRFVRFIAASSLPAGARLRGASCSA